MTACIVAIAKDEGSYLYEWASYHIALGFDKIYLYDNDSSDHPEEVLKNLSKHVEIIKWPTIENISPQLSAYNNPALKIRDLHDFVAYIDIDEFITLRKHENINSYLDTVPEEVSAVAINQKIFGSSFLDKYEDLPVTVRFQKCAIESHPEHLWYKSIYRTRDIKQINSCHMGDLIKGQYTDSKFNSDNIDKNSPGQTKKNASDDIHVNHYILKSKEEFETKKKLRGGGMNATKKGRLERYDNDYFFSHRDSYANKDSDDHIVKLIQTISAKTGITIYPQSLTIEV